MTLLAERRLLRRGTGVSLALLGALLLAPSARASCGDYVKVGDQPAGHSALAGGPVHGPAHPADRHAPCSGPNCLRHPLQAPLTPVNPAPVRESWGCPPALPPPPKAATAGAAPDESTGSPVRRVRAIYHPPRR